MKHTDECLLYAAQTGKAYCIEPCAKMRGLIAKHDTGSLPSSLCELADAIDSLEWTAAARSIRLAINGLQEFKPGVYEHYKGGRYIAMNLVTHHETKEKFVVYVSLTHGTLRLREWNTPGKDSWCDVVNVPHQQGVLRFKYIGPAE